MTILINGVPHRWTRQRIKFHHCCFLCDPVIPGKEQENVEISYSIMRGQMKEHGYLPPGSSVKVREGMEFRVRVKQMAP